MNETLAVLVPLFCCTVLPLGFAVLPFVIGYSRRRRALADVAAREAQVAGLLAATASDVGPGGGLRLVLGNVVYAADAPSTFAASWRNLVGGPMESLRMQADLARRLATVRALEQARQLGAHQVVNLRAETSDVLSSQGKQGKPLIEVLVYGTALTPPARSGARAG